MERPSRHVSDPTDLDHHQQQDLEIFARRFHSVLAYTDAGGAAAELMVAVLMIVNPNPPPPPLKRH